MKKYQCYYNEVVYVDGRAYIGKRVDKECFDTEEQAERYCSSHVGITEYSDGIYDEHEMMYDEIEVNMVNEQDKMIDFFTTTKEQFLKFYSDVTEEEYETTKQDVLNRSGYWNSQYADIEDGITVGKILQSIMMIEWLKGKE